MGGIAGMGHGGGRRRAENSPEPSGKKKHASLRELWPDLREMILPRRKILALGFLLMVINRLAGLVLPGSTKYLIDDVVGNQRVDLLTPLVLAILGATMVQGATSFALTQLLSKTGQRLIAELRLKVQRHIGSLPIAYYDSNKSGTLVSRIMTDVEGVRNIIGTGLVEFVGGVMTAVISLVVLLTISVSMTAWTAVAVGLFAFVLSKAAFSEKAATENGVSATRLERAVTRIVPAVLIVERLISVRNGSPELHTSKKLPPGTRSRLTGLCPTGMGARNWFWSVE